MGVARVDAAVVIDDFLAIGGAPSGYFGWDTFVEPYAGPHSPDQFSVGTGNAAITAAPGGAPPFGGFVTGDDLYSFFETPTWTVALSGLDTSDPLTSLAVQIAVSRGQNVATLSASDFTIAGIAPAEFIELGMPGDSGLDFYWAEWQGLTALSDYSVEISGAAPGPHTQLAGASAAYFNTSSAFNITAVPEPGTCVALAVAGLGAVIQRRRLRAACAA